MNIERALLGSCKRLGKALSRYRGNRFVDLLVDCCDGFRRAANNVNFDMRSNGEIRVLRILGGFDMARIFDVGANIGEWCLSAAEIFPGCEIHSFEIVPTTFARLRDNVQSNPNIRTNNFGLSKTDGVMEVFLPEKETSTATLYPVAGALEQAGWYKSRINCEVRTASRYLRENGIDRIDFLKIDVEGADFDVLLGFAGDIDKVRVIQFEYGVFNIASHALLFDFWHYFKKHGFVLGKIYPRRVSFFEYGFWKEDFAGNNYLAVRETETELIRLLANGAINRLRSGNGLPLAGCAEARSASFER